MAKNAKANTNSNFVSVSGECKLKFYRREKGGTFQPFFEDITFPSSAEENLNYLQDQGVLCRITLTEIEKSMFEPDEKDDGQGKLDGME